jgi:predicted RNA-binding protein YlqC (UPF0109 family)
MSDAEQTEHPGGQGRPRDLVELLVKSLVDCPDEVEVEEQVGERSLVIRVRVPGDQVGRVIGRGGRIANSLRLLAKAAGARERRNVWVDIAKSEGDADQAGEDQAQP